MLVFSFNFEHFSSIVRVLTVRDQIFDIILGVIALKDSEFSAISDLPNTTLLRK